MTRRRLTAEDLYRIELPAQPCLSPDGAWVAYVHSHVDPETREYVSRIWRLPAAGGSPRRFTGGPGNDLQPAWSPDGSRLAFVRRSTAEDDPGRDQIWVIDTAGGEAWQLTRMPLGATAPVWSPDGRMLAFAARAVAGPDGELVTRPFTAEEREARRRRARDEGRRITALWYKSDPGGGLKPAEPLQTWVVDVPDLPPATPPDPIPVTGGEFDHRPSAFAPDGRRLAVLSNHAADPEGSFLLMDIWLYPVPGSGEVPAGGGPAPVNVTGGRGHFEGAAFSPDGRRLAALGHRYEQMWATHYRLWLFPADPAAGEEPACLTAGWDRSARDTVGSDMRGSTPVGAPRWSPDGRILYFLASDAGSAQVWQVPAAGGTPEPVTAGDWQIYGWSMDRACTRLAMAATDFCNPGDVYALDLPAGELRRLTDLSAGWRDQVSWPERLHLTVPSDGGWQLDAWLIKPAGWQPGRRYPLVLEVHGGPYTAYGHAFYQEFHLLAAQGYAVLYANPRGSTSYGEALCAAIDGDWGGGDMRDLLAAVDAAVATGWVDPGRLGVTGGSYGGFMTAWMIAHSDRFAAAVAHRGLYNWISFAGVADIGPWFTAGAHGTGPAWRDGARLWELSPLRWADQMHTPLLICHSEGDHRTPIEQAEQLYTALRWLGRDVEFVRHPRSTHDLTRIGPPAVRVDRLLHIARWFGRWLPVHPDDYALS